MNRWRQARRRTGWPGNYAAEEVSGGRNGEAGDRAETPAGTYNLTVTATVGSTNQSQMLKLTVSRRGLTGIGLAYEPGEAQFSEGLKPDGQPRQPLTHSECRLAKDWTESGGIPGYLCGKKTRREDLFS
jgi:hypothetical protein